MTLQVRGVLLALLMIVSSPFVSSAQDNYPSRQISLIVPYAAGGSIDLVARIVAEGLAARLGQAVVVENKPGGTGNRPA